jgi:hypothetical protein
MKIKSLLVAGVAVAGLVAGAAFADAYMKGEDVAKLIVGNTIEGQFFKCEAGAGAGRQDFAEFYDPNGRIRGHERPCSQAGSWSRYGGSWEVKNGKFCVNLGSGRSNGCFDYQVDKDGTLRRFNDNGATDLTFKIYDGNPDHL